MKYDVSSHIEKRGIICGMVLGDGGRHRKTMFIGHSVKQADYLVFKKALLEEIVGGGVCVVNVDSRFNGKVYSGRRLYPKGIPLIRKVVAVMYPNGGPKKISDKVLNWLTLQGVAIWYMDDGSCSFKKKDGIVHGAEVTLNTYVSREENELIIKYFKERWGINWGLNRSKGKWRLRMGTIEGRCFFSLIAPYIISSMAYKIAIHPAKCIGYRNLRNPIGGIYSSWGQKLEALEKEMGNQEEMVKEIGRQNASMMQRIMILEAEVENIDVGNPVLKGD